MSVKSPTVENIRSSLELTRYAWKRKNRDQGTNHSFSRTQVKTLVSPHRPQCVRVRPYLKTKTLSPKSQMRRHVSHLLRQVEMSKRDLTKTARSVENQPLCRRSISITTEADEVVQWENDSKEQLVQLAIMRYLQQTRAPVVSVVIPT